MNNDQHIDHLFSDIVPAKALGIQVVSFENGHIKLSAPLHLNVNDKGSAFAGSMASILSLAGWGAITASLLERSIQAEVMVVKSEISYTAAARSDLSAETEVSSVEMGRVCRELDKLGRSRIEVSAQGYDAENLCAEMTASYAVFIR